MGARGRALALMASLLVAFAFGAERAAEAKYSPGANVTAGVKNATAGKNATKAKPGMVQSKLTSLSLLIDEAAALRSKNGTAKVNGTKDSVTMKLARAQKAVGELEKTAPCLEAATVAKLSAAVDAADDEVANSNSTGADGEIEDPMLAKTAKMARIVKFLQSKAQNASCTGAPAAPKASTPKVPRNRTAEILTLKQYMQKMTKYDSKRFLTLAKNGSKDQMAAVEKAMLAVGVAKKLNSTEKRIKVHFTVKAIADEYGVNNNSAVVDEVAESLYDKAPPPPPPVKPTFPEGFNETMFAFLRNMSAKADKDDVGAVGQEAEDEEALKVSAMMGKLTAAQIKEFMPKMADAQAAVAKEDRRLMAMKLKLELMCKNKTLPGPPKPTVNVSSYVKRLVFNITGRTHLGAKQEKELQAELDTVPQNMDKEAVDDLENLVKDLKAENATIEAENNRTLAKNNATKALEKKEAEDEAKPKAAPLPGPARAGIFGIFGR